MNEVEFNPQFVSRMIPKLEWSALVQAADEVRQTHTVLDHYRETLVIVYNLSHISVQSSIWNNWSVKRKKVMIWLYIGQVRDTYCGHFMIHPLVFLFLFGNKSWKISESGCVNHCWNLSAVLIRRQVSPTTAGTNADGLYQCCEDCSLWLKESDKARDFTDITSFESVKSQSLVLFLNVYKQRNILLLSVLIKMSCTSYVVTFLSFFPLSLLLCLTVLWSATIPVVYWKCLCTCVFLSLLCRGVFFPLVTSF